MKCVKRLLLCIMLVLPFSIAHAVNYQIIPLGGAHFADTSIIVESIPDIFINGENVLNPEQEQFQVFILGVKIVDKGLVEDTALKPEILLMAYANGTGLLQVHRRVDDSYVKQSETEPCSGIRADISLLDLDGSGIPMIVLHWYTGAKMKSNVFIYRYDGSNLTELNQRRDKARFLSVLSGNVIFEKTADNRYQINVADEATSKTIQYGLRGGMVTRE